MADQSRQLEFTIKSTVLDRPRQLTLDPDYLEFDDNDLAAALPSRFLKEEIESLRFGVKGIRGYKFYIGRIYCIDIKSKTGRIMKIHLKSLYRIRIAQLSKKHNEIVNALFNYYFNAIGSGYIDLFMNENPFELLGVDITTEGAVFDKKVGRIPWHYLGIRTYNTYYTLFSETDPNQYKAFEYLHDWNAVVLLGVLESIFDIKFPDRKNAK